MGYRSNVFFAIAGELDALEAFLAAARLMPEFNLVFTEFAIKRARYEERAVFVIQGCWKHYETYPEVVALEAFWAHAHADEEHLDGVYIIVGEDPGDMSRRYFGSGGELASISASIDSHVTFDAT